MWVGVLFGALAWGEAAGRGWVERRAWPNSACVHVAVIGSTNGRRWLSGPGSPLSSRGRSRCRSAAARRGCGCCPLMASARCSGFV